MTRPNNGFSMIEVLVTIVILMIGLLGLAGLQARALTSQMESYQRAQALILLKDMADRINANRANIASYLTSGLTPPYLGTGDAQPTNCAALTGQARDFCEWSNALKGAAEQQGGSNVGAMIGARGCVYQKKAAATGEAAEYVVVVAWQGINSTAAPENATAASPGKCGAGTYKDKDGNAKAALHRVVSLPIDVAFLTF